MSYLGRKQVTDKISNAAKAAEKNGDDLASTVLLFLSSIYLRGRNDLMQYVRIHVQAAARYIPPLLPGD